MQRYHALLASFATLRAFDYPYMAAGRRAPDRLPVLVEAHRAELARFRAELGLPSPQLVLAGKSMGGRVGCHVALEEKPSGVVCFGYPLRGQNGRLRDEVLLALRCPVLFVQGTRDAMCPLAELEQVRKRMRAPSALMLVDGGDHSLQATKTLLRQRGTTQLQLEQLIGATVQEFIVGL